MNNNIIIEKSHPISISRKICVIYIGRLWAALQSVLITAGLITVRLITTRLISTGLINAGLITMGLITTALITTRLITTGLITMGLINWVEWHAMEIPRLCDIHSEKNWVV